MKIKSHKKNNKAKDWIASYNNEIIIYEQIQKLKLYNSKNLTNQKDCKAYIVWTNTNAKIK